MKGTRIRENVVYGYADGKPLFLDIIRSDESTAHPLPVIMYIHGGGWMGGDKGGIGGRVWSSRFALQGFVVVNVNHRLSGEAIFPAQIHDVKKAVRWLRANAQTLSIDPDKIGVWGHSSGGHLAALLGTTQGVEVLEGSLDDGPNASTVQAVCTLSAPVDLLAMGDWHDLPFSPEARLVGKRTLQEGRDLAIMANPLTHVSGKEPPFFIIHGDADEIVPPSQAELLYHALPNASYLRVKGADHGYSGGNLSMDDILEMIQAFFIKQLTGTPESPEDIEKSREETRAFLAYFRNQSAPS